MLDKAEMEAGTSTLMRTRRLTAAATARPLPPESGRTSGLPRQASSPISAGPRLLKLVAQFSFTTTTLGEGGRRLCVITDVQLDWTANTSRQKINLPTNQKGYDTFETTVGKLSTRRIQICLDYFCSGIVLKVILNNSK